MDMVIYFCGDAPVGMTMGGKNTGEMSLKSISGSLYPPRLGAEVHLEYTGTYAADRKFDSASSMNCKVTGQRPATELDPRLTGSAWVLRCSSKTTFTGGHVSPPILNETVDHLLEDLGVKASAIFPMNIKQKTYPSPKIGVREEYLSVEGDYGSRQWKTFTAFDWTVGQPAP